MTLEKGVSLFGKVLERRVSVFQKYCYRDEKAVDSDKNKKEIPVLHTL